MTLRVGIDQQHTAVGRIGAAQQLTDAERDIGGGCRFPDTPFVIGENEHTSHCHFLSVTHPMIDFAVAGKDSSEE